MPTVGYRFVPARRLRRRRDAVVHSSEPGSNATSAPPTATPASAPPAVFAGLGPKQPGEPGLHVVAGADGVLEVLGVGVADIEVDGVGVGVSPGKVGNPLGPVLVGVAVGVAGAVGVEFGQPLPGTGNFRP
jgi:hypothetical protein